MKTFLTLSTILAICQSAKIVPDFKPDDFNRAFPELIGDNLTASWGDLTFKDSINLLNEELARQTPPVECPQIAPRDNCDPELTQDVCWSPGEMDVDCRLNREAKSEDGEDQRASEVFGLCCFDGCQNTCLKQKCKTVMTTKIEQEVQEQCHDAHRQECHDMVREECKNECKNVVEMQPETVPHEVCHQVQKEECKKVVENQEMCKNLEINITISIDFGGSTQPGSSQCPEPANAPESCEGQVNTCWSPGEPDVDCPLPMGPGETTQEFGLCCFNGCANTCLKPEREIPENCEEIEKEPVCETVNDLVCDYNEEEFCTKIVRRYIPKADASADEKCTFHHNHKFARSHIRQRIFNVDSRQIEWEDKCNPLEKVCSKSSNCKQQCQSVEKLRKVPRETEKCTTQAPRNECRTVMVQKCYPLVNQYYPTSQVYVTNMGQKKSKGHKKGKKGHWIHKREAHKSKGWSKGHKGEIDMVPDSYMNSYISHQCEEVPEMRCEIVTQPPLCEIIRELIDEPYTEEFCKQVCEESCQNVLCPPGGNPDFEECVTSEVTEIVQQIEDYCYPKGQEPFCKKVPVERCANSGKKVVCKECENVPYEKEVCWNKPEQVCKTETKVIEKPVTREVCEEKCWPETQEVCKLVPYQECAPVLVDVEVEVPKEVCEW